MAQTLPLLFAGLWNAENPRTGGRAGLPARSGRRGPGAFAGRWASGSKNVGQGRGCSRLLQGPTGRMLLAFQVSFLLTMPGPRFFASGGSQNHSQCSISSGKSLLFTGWHDVLTFYLVPAHNRPSSFQERTSEETNPGVFGFPVMQVFSDGS